MSPELTVVAAEIVKSKLREAWTSPVLGSSSTPSVRSANVDLLLS